MALHQGAMKKKFYAFVRLRPQNNCPVSDRPCGNVQFHARLVDSGQDPAQQTSFAAGVVYPYGLAYEIGTPEQLEALGYPMPR